MVAAQLHQIARQMRRNNIAHIRSELASLPCIRAGSRTNHGSKLEVLRYYTKEQGKRTVHQHDATTEKGVELQSLMKQKEQLTAFLESLPLQKELECEISSCSEKQSINSGRFSKARFDQLVELKDTSISKGLPFDGRLFRSKSEVMIAQYLKALGLEYKYEVIVSIGGKEYYIDFAVYSRETGRFFFIEHFGMMSDDAYRARAFQKITTYLSNGLQEGIDILFTCESANDGFNINMIKGKILGILSAQMLSSM